MESDMREYFKVLLRRSWFIALMAILFCGAAAAYHVMYSKPVYQASTKLIVNNIDRANDDRSADFNQVNLSLLYLETYKEIIGTPAIMGKVAALHPEFGKTAKQLTEQVDVSTSAKSQVVTLSATDYSPEEASRLANAVAEVFKQEISKIMNVNNVTILSEAQPEEFSAPVSKGIVYKMAIAFVLSLMISIGAVFLWEYLDDTIKSEEDIAKHLRQPTLVVIRQMKRAEIKKDHRRSKKRSPGDSVSVGVNHQA